MLLVGKVIGRVEKGVFGVSLHSHVTDNNFNEMILFGVMGFSVKKEYFLRYICDISHPNPDSIQEYASLGGGYQGATYNLDDVINNDSDSEDMKNRFII